MLVEQIYVQPIYCLKIDTRQSQPEEIYTQKIIIKEISDLSSLELILPTIVVGEIPKDTDINLAARAVVARFGLSSQWPAMARYSLLEDTVAEVGHNAKSPSFKWPYGPKRGLRNLISPHLVGDGSDRRVVCPETPYLHIFRNLRFPLSNTTKEEMWELSIKHGFSSVLEKTYSCWHPKADGTACGLCFCCDERFLK